ncbi:MAG: hypothetical protein F6K48_32310 [Okeania sp. SIO3H1]|nr:hypothetical protein [Okeania sp. SIO1I7]NEN93316.1 hypothetical protein [Okeania sp. SIO3H1]NET29609.1 hypothetical protein [Okeania sp. SIO1I7]
MLRAKGRSEEVFEGFFFSLYKYGFFFSNYLFSFWLIFGIENQLVV